MNPHDDDRNPPGIDASGDLGDPELAAQTASLGRGTAATYPAHRYPPAHPRSPSRSHSSSRRKLRQWKLLSGLLVFALVVATIVGIFGLSQLKRFRSEAMNLSTKLRQTEGELVKVRERVADMNNDLRVLLDNRIPGIDSIVYNRQIELNQGYVRNITFVRSGIGDDGTIEYSAVVANDRDVPILPRVTIVLFDEVGLQTGAVTLDRRHAVSPVTIPELQAGETRTYSGRVDMQRRTPSRYFVVEVN